MKYSQNLKLVEALRKLEEAASILQSLQTEAERSRDWGMAGSIGDFNRQVHQIIECDHGEAGLKPFVNSLK